MSSVKTLLNLFIEKKPLNNPIKCLMRSNHCTRSFLVFLPVLAHSSVRIAQFASTRSKVLTLVTPIVNGSGARGTCRVVNKLQIFRIEFSNQTRSSLSRARPPQTGSSRCEPSPPAWLSVQLRIGPAGCATGRCGPGRAGWCSTHRCHNKRKPIRAGCRAIIIHTSWSGE